MHPGPRSGGSGHPQFPHRDIGAACEGSALGRALNRPSSASLASRHFAHRTRTARACCVSISKPHPGHFIRVHIRVAIRVDQHLAPPRKRPLSGGRRAGARAWSGPIGSMAPPLCLALAARIDAPDSKGLALADPHALAIGHGGRAGKPPLRPCRLQAPDDSARRDMVPDSLRIPFRPSLQTGDRKHGIGACSGETQRWQGSF
jgi:hypothetical protein